MTRIVFLTPQLPHPPVSGGVIKSRKLIEFLASKHEVHLFTLVKGSCGQHINEFCAAVPLAGFYSDPIAIPRSMRNFIRSIIAGVPLSVYRNWSLPMQGMVNNQIAQADVVFVDHFLMFQYVPESFEGRIVLHEHNAEYVMWRRFAAVENNLFRKVAAITESVRIRAYEARICERSHAVLAAPNDIEALTSIGIPRNKFIETLHLGDERLLLFPEIIFNKTQPYLLYVGSLDWEANRDGLLWFLKEVWPLVAAKHVGIQCIIIGRNPGSEIALEVSRLAGVELLGFVDDLEPYYAQARVFIAPLRFGSGIKVKVINALCRGLPVVTTSVGAEGLHVESGHEMFIADSPVEMAKDIDALLANEHKWTMMRDAARKLAKREYTWDLTLSQVEDAVHG